MLRNTQGAKSVHSYADAQQENFLSSWAARSGSLLSLQLATRIQDESAGDVTPGG